MCRHLRFSVAEHLMTRARMVQIKSLPIVHLRLALPIALGRESGDDESSKHVVCGGCEWISDEHESMKRRIMYEREDFIYWFIS